ncbi:MAG: MFS transporter [bacterium]
MHRQFAPLFKNRQFVLLWINQALSQISYNLLNFTLVVLVYKLTQSTLAVSILIIFFFLPSLIFSLPAGVISDLLDKRKVMIGADILWAGTVFLIFLNRDHFWAVLFLTFGAKFFDSFFFPAEAAALPQVTKKENLIEANSLFSFTTYGAMLLGFGLAGPLMRFVGQGAPLVLAGILTFGGSLALAALKPLKGESSLGQIIGGGGFWSTICTKVEEGLTFLKNQWVILGAIVVSVLGQVFSTLLSNIMPEYAEKSLKVAAEDISFVLVLPAALGIVLGLFTLNKFLKPRLKRVSVRLGMALLSLALLGLSLAPLAKRLVKDYHLVFNGPLAFESLPGVSALAALFAALAGFGAALILIPALTFSQQNIPSGLRGRAFGFYGSVTAFLVIGLVVPLGGVAEVIGIPVILAALAVFIFTAFILSFKISALKTTPFVLK